MTTAGTSAAALPTHDPAKRRRGLIALCVTEITSWGVLYYAFPVIAGTITADTTWSTASVMAAFSIGLAVSAAAGIPVGRLLDRHGPRPVMTAGSVLGVAAVAGIALAPTIWWFMAAWALSGLAQACVFYKPAFAAITGWYGPARVKALTVLTLVAGLSSTIFAPATAALADHTDWRTTYLLLAGLLAVVTIPAHAKFLNVPWKPNDHKISDDQPTHNGAHAVIRTAPFLLLTGVVTTATFALFLATINMVPMLTENGASISFAAWTLGLCGAGQLLGRIGYAQLTSRTTVRTRTVAVLISAAVALAAVAFTAGQAVAVVFAAVAFGAARGIFTLLEATAVSDRWGTRGFGTLYGIYSAPSTIAMAATPFAGAVMAAWLGGNQALFLVLAAALIVAGIAAIWTVPRARTPS